MKPNGKAVYIAAPYTGDGTEDPVDNYEDYLEIVAAAMNAGYAVISWGHTHETHTRCLTDFTGEEYVDFDLLLVAKADELWLAHTGQRSRGMDREAAHAAALGIPTRTVCLTDGRLVLSEAVTGEAVA